MGSNLTVNKEIEEYINNNSIKLHPVQKEIISHNQELGDIKRMQISVSQCHFLHLLIKSSKIKKILEIGTFTGLSTLSMSLALPEDGSVLALDKNPVDIVKEKGLKQQSDPKKLEKLIEKVINENQDKVQEYKSGKEKLFGFFVGQAMKVSGGKANPQLVNDILKKKLK